MANNRVMRELMNNINDLKAEILDHRNNERFLPVEKEKRKKKSRTRRSSRDVVDPYRIIEED